nr:right-handed parallel beta-helix repeat-containing protein [Candidatus Sigynarchaeota archaeon]
MRVRNRSSIVFVMFLVFISTISNCVFLSFMNKERSGTRPAQVYYDISTIIAAGSVIPHEPIQIAGDDQLIAFFQGNSSNGSAANPFILENFSIDASSAVHGMEIKDTSLYLHIRSNVIVQASNPAHSSKLPSGIMLNNVTHVVISNNTIEQNYLGIFVTGSSNVSIINNVIANNVFIGVGLNFSSSITLLNNNFKNCGVHVLGTLPDCLSINIDQSNRINEIGRIFYFKSLKNALLQALPDGSEIILVNCSSVILRGVKSFSSSVGIMLLYTNNTIIHDCVISSQNYHGIVCAGSNNNSIENNKFYGSYYSLGALYCKGCRFVGNQVFDAIFDGLVLLFCEDT